MDAWKTYSAFANTYGGLILLGVYEDLKEKDTSKRFSITGVDDADKIRKDFWNIVQQPREGERESCPKYPARHNLVLARAKR